MKTMTMQTKTLLSLAVAASLLAACTAAPVKPDGSEALRNRLTELQSNADIASRAPLAIKDAETAVAAAEQPRKDAALSQHLVLIADRKIETAKAMGESRLAVDQRKALGEQREAMRLQARTQEADSANQRAATATADAASQKQQADAARDATADAQRNSEELRRQIDELHAKETERGLVLTLGDVLFETNRSELNANGTSNLAKLARFLNKYPQRTAVIEGHTDSVGSDDYNQNLSQRRANAVQAYLLAQGIGPSRLVAAGKGKSSPVADNGSASGRAQNRRVEVIIQNSAVS